MGIFMGPNRYSVQNCGHLQSLDRNNATATSEKVTEVQMKPKLLLKMIDSSIETDHIIALNK